MQNALISDSDENRWRKLFDVRPDCITRWFLDKRRLEKVVWNVSYRSQRGRYRKINDILNMFIANARSETTTCDKRWTHSTRRSLEEKITMRTPKRNNPIKKQTNTLFYERASTSAWLLLLIKARTEILRFRGTVSLIDQFGIQKQSVTRVLQLSGKNIPLQRNYPKQLKIN